MTFILGQILVWILYPQNNILQYYDEMYDCEVQISLP